MVGLDDDDAKRGQRFNFLLVVVRGGGKHGRRTGILWGLLTFNSQHICPPFGKG